MFRTLPAYAATRPDEFWAARVPEHWQVLPGMAVVSENKCKNDGLIESQVLSLSFGQVIVKPVEKQRGLVPESYEGYQVLDPGDIVIRPTDLQNDQRSIRVGMVRDRGIITSAYIGLRARQPWSTDYAHAYLVAVDSTKRIYGMGSGLRQQLGWVDLKRMPCLVPPKDEQAAIVKYLAHANSRIDKAIAAKRRLIALLGQSRTAVVDSLVLGRDVQNRRPSPAPWLESVPSGWEWRRCRTLTSFITSGSRGWAEYYADAGPMFLQSGNLGRKLDLKLAQVQRLALPASATEGVRTRVQPRDVLVCITGALTGNVAVIPDDWRDEAYVNQHVALVRPRHVEVDSQFLGHAMKSQPCQFQFKGSEYGGTKQGLGLDEVKNLEVLLPPLAEQRAIVTAIKVETEAIDSAIRRAEQEVAVLGEFRTRLVADVVTGQVDVRGIADNLPGIDLNAASGVSGLADASHLADLDDALTGSET